MRLKELIKDINVLRFIGYEKEDIKGISNSSKLIRAGYLFTAITGEKFDGNDYIMEAFNYGAAAVVSEMPKDNNINLNWIQVSDAREALARISAAFYSYPSENMKMTGITGTKGKTTTTYLLEAILDKANLHSGVIGTISYRGPNMEIPADRTTPEALDIQRFLKEMLDHGATHCVMEVSSHSLDLKRIVGIGFDVVIFTNLSGEHLDYHQNMEKYFQAKKQLFTLDQTKSTSVINSDDIWGKKLISSLSSDMITYGLESPANVRAVEPRFSEQGIEFSLKYPAGNMKVSSPLLGKPNLYNILAAIAGGLALNIPVKTIVEGISSLQGVPGRFEKVKNDFGLNIFVDYAHTDDALRNLLETARELCQKNVILVFGAGGDRDKDKRPRMGEVAGNLADWTILTSDNPRSEDPLAILDDIVKGIEKSGSGKYEIQPDRKKAIKKAITQGKKGDFILIAGKGHETYQIIKDKVSPFNDVEVIKEAIKKLERD